MSDLVSLLRAEANIAARPGSYERLNMLATAVEGMTMRAERVIRLHKPREPRTGIGVRTEKVCEECSQAADRFDEVEWPCETVRILTGNEP